MCAPAYAVCAVLFGFCLGVGAAPSERSGVKDTEALAKRIAEELARAPAVSKSGVFVARHDGASRREARQLVDMAAFLETQLSDFCGLAPLSSDRARFEFLCEGETSTSNAAPTLSFSCYAGRPCASMKVPLDGTPATRKIGHLFCRGWLLLATAVRSEGGQIPEVPEWLLTGTIAGMRRQEAEAYFEHVYRRWSQGKLPRVDKLLVERESSGEVDVALAVSLVDWLRGRTRRGEHLRQLYEEVAKSGRLSLEHIARLRGDAAGEKTLDDKWDLWLLARRRSISDFGKVLPGRLARFRQRRLVSPEHAALWGGGLFIKRALDPAELLDRREEAWVPAVAGGQARYLVALAAGRGKRFEKMVRAHVNYFVAVAAGESVLECELQLQQAEALLIAMEAQLAPTGTRSVQQSDKGRPAHPAG